MCFSETRDNSVRKSDLGFDFRLKNDEVTLEIVQAQWYIFDHFMLPNMIYSDMSVKHKENQHIFHEYFDGAGEIRNGGRQLEVLKTISMLS